MPGLTSKSFVEYRRPITVEGSPCTSTRSTYEKAPCWRYPRSNRHFCGGVDPLLPLESLGGDTFRRRSQDEATKLLINLGREYHVKIGSFEIFVVLAVDCTHLSRILGGLGSLTHITPSPLASKIFLTVDSRCVVEFSPCDLNKKEGARLVGQCFRRLGAFPRKSEPESRL